MGPPVMHFYSGPPMHLLSGVDNLGPVALSNLKNWRSQQQRRFKFDPNKGIDPMAKNKVEQGDPD